MVELTATNQTCPLYKPDMSKLFAGHVSSKNVCGHVHVHVFFCRYEHGFSAGTVRDLIEPDGCFLEIS